MAPQIASMFSLAHEEKGRASGLCDSLGESNTQRWSLGIGHMGLLPVILDVAASLFTFTILFNHDTLEKTCIGAIDTAVQGVTVTVFRGLSISFVVTLACLLKTIQ